jgi:phage protein D/phage baseplate assembly protein gpV
MPERQELASRVYVSLDGSEVERAIMDGVLEVVVDQHAHLPGMFTIRLADPELKILDEGPFELARSLKIEGADTGGAKVTLFEGEIVALEPAFNEGMIAELVVRGYDKSHRLYRQTRSVAYLNKKDSDLAQEIAQAAGLEADVETTATVYDHIFQDNQSDLAFLMERAWRIGYECFVDDGKLHFRRPPDAGSGDLTLTWGEDLLTFHPRLSLAEQVDEVIVRGWDPEQQEAIVGRASSGRLYPERNNGEQGADLASRFGRGRLVLVDMPVISQAEADALAAARLDELSGAFITADGSAFRRPDIRAGRLVKLEHLGQRFSGTYLVTQATHVVSPDGLQTHFRVQGTRTGTLAESLGEAEPLRRWPGVVPAVVTNANDPENAGRVRLKFPWMTDDAESTWARVLGAGAGPEAGHYFIPDVGDEVLVAFEHGDFSRPYVLGGLWSGSNKVPPEQGSGSEAPQIRIWRSRTGHLMAMYDNQANKVEIKTAGGHTVLLDDAGRTITISSNGGHTVTLDDSAGKVTVESSNEMTIKSQGNLAVEAGANLDLKANGQVNVRGAVINLN